MRLSGIAAVLADQISVTCNSFRPAWSSSKASIGSSYNYLQPYLWALVTELRGTRIFGY